MILTGNYASAAQLPLSHRALIAASLADSLMAKDSDESKNSIKDDWGGGSGKDAGAFLKPEDFDLYVNKITGETYIFHGPDLPHEVERLEYDPEECRVAVITKDGRTMDLGVKIQWLIRPYFSRAETVYIVKTKDGEAVDGIEVPMSVKGAKEQTG